MELREKIARAICGNWVKGDDRPWQQWTEEADAVIEVLAKQEPVGYANGDKWVTIHRARLTALEAAESATERVVAKYDAYRRRGVSPAPVEYAQVVEAIEDARDVLGPNAQVTGFIGESVWAGGDK